jgi:hypothetical protein
MPELSNYTEFSALHDRFGLIFDQNSAVFDTGLGPARRRDGFSGVRSAKNSESWVDANAAGSIDHVERRLDNRRCSGQRGTGVGGGFPLLLACQVFFRRRKKINRG